MSIFIRNGKYGRSWSEIFFDFWDLAKEGLENQMKMKRRRILKRSLAAFLFFIGGIYFLNGIVELLAKILGGSKWASAMIVGGLLILIGAIVNKNNKI